MMLFKRGSLGILMLSFIHSGLAGGGELDERHFDVGKREISVGAHALFSPFVAEDGRPTVNYGGAMAQYGYMLTDVKEQGPLRGNFQILGELSASGVFKGKGDYIASTSLLFRYNLVPEGWRLVPFLQIGGGVSLADLDRKVFGGPFEFNLNVGPGVRYLVTSECSLNAEYRIQHISNAGISEHNLGINAHGLVVSFSRFF